MVINPLNYLFYLFLNEFNLRILTVLFTPEKLTLGRSRDINLENLKKIFVLVKEKGFTLEGAKKELKEGNIEIHTHTPQNNQTLIDKLSELKAKLKTLEAQL